MNDFIEADYKVEDDDKGKEIKINTDPLSSLIDNITDVFKEQIRCNNEFKMCKEKERTERERIRAQLEIYKDMINNKHKQIMDMIENHYLLLNNFIDSIQKKIDVAIKENNIELVKMLMDFQITCMNTENNKYLQALSDENNKGFAKIMGNNLAIKSLE